MEKLLQVEAGPLYPTEIQNDPFLLGRNLEIVVIRFALTLEYLDMEPTTFNYCGHCMW